jgi:hypothetical protein
MCHWASPSRARASKQALRSFHDGRKHWKVRMVRVIVESIFLSRLPSAGYLETEDLLFTSCDPVVWIFAIPLLHTDKPPISTNSSYPAMSASQHSTTKDVFGPGTYVDTEFHSVPDESRRLLRLLASKTPGFTQDEAAFSDVKFFGDDLSIIPGPLKSQALVSVVRNAPREVQG